ncbi:MAG TPA: YafY family protein [Rhodopila sp.]|uniref:helix-turn-helix transcriptional regulator n=1 Tax=Rhodopila sp. TaxID=2480087 RepID=UPI002BDA8CFE|nr:YafY family protein [Rhodopila sp.]HVY16625.1 YafY family protein [Rhodopila sp.]
MRRADRLFDIIQALRSASGPLTAAAIAGRLEVTPRTIYRDIASLQASRVPIEGAAGVGYVLRRGFDLPPLMFSTEEADAIAVGMRLLHRLRDAELWEAAERVLSKIAAVLPESVRRSVGSAPFYVSDGSSSVPDGISLSVVRAAIRDRRKLRLGYGDGEARQTERTVWPIALMYYVDVTVVAAWCELRSDYRHFRVDRIRTLSVLDDRYPADQRDLVAGYEAAHDAHGVPASGF